MIKKYPGVSGISALTGDVTATGPGSAAATIASDKIVNSMVKTTAAIAISKLQMNTNKLLGRGTASAGAVEEITLGTGLSLTGTTLDSTGGFTNPMTTGGDVIYGGASGVATRLANGSSGQVLTSAGSTSAPTWTTPGGTLLSWTPTGSWTTNTTYSSNIYIVGGNRMQGVIKLAFSGVPDATNLTINMHPSWLIDTTWNSASSPLGHMGTIQTSGAAVSFAVTPVYGSTTSILMYDATASSSPFRIYPAANPLTKTNPITIGNGSVLLIPINMFVTPA